MKKHLMVFAALMFAVAVSFHAFAADLSHPNRDEMKKLDETSCADGFSFAVIGDSHVSRNVFPRIIDQIKETKPDFVVSVGDFTNNGLPEEYEEFVNRITGAGVPWFAVPGNHEYRDPSGHTSSDGNKRFEKIFGDSDFMFEHCGWRFVALDVVAFDMIRPDQLKKLKRALDGSEGRAAVFMHYPPGIMPHWEEGFWKANAPEFMKILEENKVRFFFSGHIHVFDWQQVGPTTYIVTGGGSEGVDSERTPDTLNAPDAGAFPHYILVSVDGDEASYKVIRMDSAPPAPADGEEKE
jgi:3',5'-cyclic AMP phosphodiesterase CpdA